MFGSVGVAHDGSHRSQCDESGCSIDGRSSFQSGAPGLKRNRFDDQRLTGYRDAECRDGECCIDRQCDPAAGHGARDCRDGSCDTGHGYESGRQQNRRPDIGQGDIADRRPRLDNPFRPASRNQQRFDSRRREVIPTGFNARRPDLRGIQWESSIQAAVNQAQRSGLPIVVQVSAPWCPHCQRMKQETWTNPQLAGLINQNFVAVTVNSDEQRDFVRQMGIKSLPTTLIVAPDLKIMNRVQGFQSAQQLLRLMSR